MKCLIIDWILDLGWGGGAGVWGAIKNIWETSQVGQWLRLRLPVQGVQVPSLVGELRSHMPGGQKTKT